jgi:hypothetical protein
VQSRRPMARLKLCGCKRERGKGEEHDGYARCGGSQTRPLLHHLMPSR